jgi:lipopolysaccharide biosynthesis glycosyltransferase
MSSERVILTYALDDFYIYPFLVSCHSAKKVFNEKVLIEVIHPTNTNLSMGMSEEGLLFCTEVLAKLKIELKITEIDLSKSTQVIESLPVWSRFPRTTWLRFFAFYDDFAKRDQNIFYLDPDTLFFCVNTEWYKVVERTKLLAARSTAGHELFENQYNLRKSDEAGGYFNGGVLVVNPKNYSKKYPESEWWEHIKIAVQSEFSIIDQDALNLLIRGNQEWLNVNFNSYPDEFDKSRTQLIHFAGGAKPWLYPTKMERLGKTKNAKSAFELWDQTAENMKTSIGDMGLIARLAHYENFVKPTPARRIAQRFPGLARSAWEIRRQTFDKFLALLSKTRLK